MECVVRARGRELDLHRLFVRGQCATANCSREIPAASAARYHESCLGRIRSVGPLYSTNTASPRVLPRQATRSGCPCPPVFRSLAIRSSASRSGAGSALGLTSHFAQAPGAEPNMSIHPAFQPASRRRHVSSISATDRTPSPETIWVFPYVSAQSSFGAPGAGIHRWNATLVCQASTEQLLASGLSCGIPTGRRSASQSGAELISTCLGRPGEDRHLLCACVPTDVVLMAETRTDGQCAGGSVGWKASAASLRCQVLSYTRSSHSGRGSPPACALAALTSSQYGPASSILVQATCTPGSLAMMTESKGQ